MRRIRKKFKRPRLPWDTERIKEEREIKSEYGLRKKREIMLAEDVLRNFRQRARELIAVENPEAEKVLLDRLLKLGLLTEKGTGLDDVLAMTTKNILERRLQTIIFKKGFSKTPKQARQLIVHGRVKIDGKKVKYPSLIVPPAVESKIEVEKVGK